MEDDVDIVDHPEDEFAVSDVSDISFQPAVILVKEEEEFAFVVVDSDDLFWPE